MRCITHYEWRYVQLASPDLLIIIIIIVCAGWIIGRSMSENGNSVIDKNDTMPLPPLRPERRNVPPPFSQEHARPAKPRREIIGKAYVIDGDSIVINKTQVRLYGVDAPEMQHPHGRNAKWALVALCKGQTIRAEVTEVDHHGRTVAKCYLPDGRDLSAEMVKQGLAIDWAKFSGGVYRQLEVPQARKKMWLADARQKGRMHVWRKFENRKLDKSNQN